MLLAWQLRVGRGIGPRDRSRHGHVHLPDAAVRSSARRKAMSLDDMIPVRPARPDDVETWLELRCALWPDGSEAEHAGDIDRFFARTSRDPAAVLLAEDAAGQVLGFAELSIRPCAEGCRTHRVGYLEGWYVVPEGRRRGVGRALVAAAEEWARARGCTEFASDTQRDNAISVAAHLALGFSDAGLVRCFRKEL